MITQAMALPPLVDGRQVYDPRPWAPYVRAAERPAHGGYPTPRRELGPAHVVDGVYAVESDEGYREKMP